MNMRDRAFSDRAVDQHERRFRWSIKFPGSHSRSNELPRREDGRAPQGLSSMLLALETTAGSFRFCPHADHYRNQTRPRSQQIRRSGAPRHLQPDRRCRKNGRQHHDLHSLGNLNCSLPALQSIPGRLSGWTRWVRGGESLLSDANGSASSMDQSMNTIGYRRRLDRLFGTPPAVNMGMAAANQSDPNMFFVGDT